MSKIVKDSRGKFAKGVVTNPEGRKKGTLNKNTLRYSNLCKLASEKYEEAFKLLWEAMEAKEGWAHQLFFKELVPQKQKRETILLNTHSAKVDAQLKALTEGLIKFDEVTEDDIHGRLKTLTAIKVSESIDGHTSELKETRESLMSKLTLLEDVIDVKRKEEDED